MIKNTKIHREEMGIYGEIILLSNIHEHVSMDVTIHK